MAMSIEVLNRTPPAVAGGVLMIIGYQANLPLP